MNRVERSHLLCFKAFPSSVSETGGCVVDSTFTARNEVDMPCLLHLRPYKPSFSLYSIYNIFKK